MLHEQGRCNVLGRTSVVRGAVVLCAVTLLAVLGAGCAADSTVGASATPSVTATPLTEHLMFHGDIAGTLTAGLDVLPPTHDNPLDVPPPRSTQCSTFDSNNTGALDDYVAVIVGVIGGTRYAVVIEVSTDNPGYTKPGTTVSLPDNLIGSVSVYELGGQQREWDVVLGPSEQFTVVVLHADRKSGTVDAWLVWPNGQSIKGLTGTLHLQGDWRCG
jgi:hypothetical protein